MLKSVKCWMMKGKWWQCELWSPKVVRQWKIKGLVFPWWSLGWMVLLDGVPLLHWLDVALYGIWRSQKWAEDEAHLRIWKKIRICAVFFNELRKLPSGSRGRHNLSVDGCHNEIWHGWQFNIQSWQEKKKPKEKDYTQSIFSRQEHSDYHETTSRKIHHIYHSMPRHDKKCKQEKYSSSQGVFLGSLQNSVVCVSKKLLGTLENPRMLTLRQRRQCLSMAELRNGGRLDRTISGALTPLIGPGTLWWVARTEVSEDGAHLTPSGAIKICAVFCKEPRNRHSRSHGCQKLLVVGCHNELWHSWPWKM